MIEIVEYRESWPLEFAEVAARLRAALGVHALAIHHIGSTGVPGLAAKDVIDVQVTVSSFAGVVEPLEGAGFSGRGKPTRDHQPPGMTLPDAELEKRFFNPLEGRKANIHVRIGGRFNHRYALLCRDYLRSHPMAASAYAEIKRQLARKFPHDADAYYDIKDPVFDLLMAGAEDWAVATAWRPSPSDG